MPFDQTAVTVEDVDQEEALGGGLRSRSMTLRALGDRSGSTSTLANSIDVVEEALRDV